MSIGNTGNNQQMAVIANLSSAENLADIRNELDRQLDNDQVENSDKSFLKKALEGKNGKLGGQILNQLAAKLNQNMPAQSILQNIKEDYKFVMDQQEGSSSDKVEIKNPTQYVNKAQKQKQNSGQGGQSGQEDQGQSPRQAVREYIGAYSQLLLAGGSEAKKKAEQMESQLLEEKGVSLKQLQGVKTQVANSVRAEVLKQIKRQYLRQIVADPKSVDGKLAKKGVQNFIDFAFFNDNLGGYDFGGYEKNLQGAVDRTTKETAEELKDFVQEKLTEEVTKKSLGSESKSVEKDIDELLKLGNKIGFDVNGYLDKLPKVKDDLGLLPLLYFDEGGAQAGAQNSDQRQGHSYQYTVEEEKEILTDKLRALYMHRALHGDLRSVLQTQFKMIKTRNGLIKLGVSNFEQIEKEGRGLAKYKLFEMLREAFEERATYAKLSGGAALMTEKKIKTILRNLEKLGVVLSRTELDAVRDKANEKMYREAEHELSLINAAIEIRGELKFFTSKRKTLMAAMERIAEESSFSKPGEELGLVREAA